MKKIFFAVFAGACILFLINCGGKEVKAHADLVFINGVIATMDDSNPSAEAVAVKGDKIFAVGSTSEIKKMIGDSTEVVDLAGKFLMPGFNESHAHFVSLGNAKLIVDLSIAKNWDEVVAMVAQAADKTKFGDWIIGWGWHQEKFDPKPEPNVEGFPIHTELSRAVPHNPVMLSHASGHAVFVNANAMKLAGINKFTPDPDGGKIIRDQEGNAIGVFEENAEQLIRKYYDAFLAKRSAEVIRADNVEQIRLASEECLKKGITSFTDAGEPFSTIDLMKELADSGRIPVRLNVMVGDSLDAMKNKLKNYFMVGYGNYHLNVRAIKQYIDGALGSRGAWMLEPYADMAADTGSNVTPIKILKAVGELAINNGFQLCIHAIGDKGNREVLNLYESIFKEHPDKKDLRWRVEHAQHLSPEDIPRFAKLGVIAAMQGVHCTSDATFVISRLGIMRAEQGAYAWRKLIDSGATICNGTDTPVEDVNPIRCFYSSVTRKSADGSALFPYQKMTRTEALKSYTVNGAYASFEENIKGTISVGKLADFTVLTNNLLSCPEEQIQNTKVVYTVVGGKILYELK